MIRITHYALRTTPEAESGAKCRASSVERGVTLLELLVVMMILSLILTAAVKTWDVTLERGRFETTTRKLDQLATAVVGNPNYTVGGQRVDYGYVGDNGRLPQTLSDLVQKPAGLLPPESLHTWRGPYIRATFSESPEGYRVDGWGDTIVYDPDSLFVRSYGGYGAGSPNRDRWITRSLGYSKAQLRYNEVSGRMLDVRGLPPPRDSIQRYPLRFGAILRYPVGSVAEAVKVGIDLEGQFLFSNVPQGVHTLAVYFFQDLPPPSKAETTYRYVTAYPGIGARGLEVRLNVDWSVGLTGSLK